MLRRARPGDTETKKSRRTLALPQCCVVVDCPPDCLNLAYYGDMLDRRGSQTRNPQEIGAVHACVNTLGVRLLNADPGAARGGKSVLVPTGVHAGPCPSRRRAGG